MVGHINALLSMHLERTQMMFLQFAGLIPKDDNKMRELQFRTAAEVKVIEELSSHSKTKQSQWLQLTRQIYMVQEDFDQLRSRYYEGDKMAAMQLIVRSRARINKFYSMVNDVVRQENANETQLQRQMTESNELAIKILCILLLLIVGIAITAAVYVNVNFKRRLDILMDNTRRMSAGLAPLAPIRGGDELAEIDEVYHQMHAAIEVLRKHERAMLENAAEAICSLDAGLSFTSVNPATEKIWGYASDELLARRVVDLIADEYKEKFGEELSQVVGSETEFRTDTKIKRKDGELADASWSVSWSKEESSLYCVVQDISARKELERIKSEFFAMVNHDLRTPLTSVQMVLDWLEIEMGEQMPANLLKSVKRAKGSAQEMLTLANSLLEMERLDRGSITLDRSKTDLAELLRTSMAQVEALAIPKDIELKADLEEVTANIDKSRMLQVTTNILTNAVKFSPAKSSIVISLKRINETCKVSIKDEGVGIAAEDLKFVFDRFRQVGSTDGRKQGFGLGLSICKSIVEAHDGQIGVESEEGKGSTFWFILNAEPA
ncbi:MAG TPA: PAS domain-containing sensor histidine kinase [Candidatus Melainabacteria bacterium]|jgi:PAS domain S-box-containing protein|nr:PAS domain-containing sensor histidine kinase [Candidatus Melainabacteria bacterium]